LGEEQRRRGSLNGDLKAYLPVGEAAVENLRAYVLFLEEMDTKYDHAQNCREQRARRTIEAAFSNDVESGKEDR